MIPKLLHFIWLGDNIPPFPKMFRDMNPDWKTVFWGENDLLWLQNQELFDNSTSHKNMQSDLARVEILYRFGGVYMDCDIVPFKPLGDFMTDLDLVAFYENEEIKPGQINNCVMGSHPKHPVWIDIINFYKTLKPPKKNTWVANYTGPVAITPYLKKYKATALPSKIFYPEWLNKRNSNPRSIDYPDSYGYHLWSHKHKLYGWV